MNKELRKFQIKNKKAISSLFIGNFKAAFSGRWIEFQDFREYSPGDDAKYIDWATSSREWITVMRRYREEKQWAVLCAIDVSESLKFGEESIKNNLIEDIVSLLWYASFWSGASFWGYILAGEDIKYIHPKKDKTVLYKILEIDDIQARPFDREFSLEKLVNQKISRKVVFVISDSLNVDMKSFSITALKHDLVYIHISTHFENTLEWSGISLLKWKRNIFWINLAQEDKKKLYHEKRKDKLEKFSKELQKHNIDTVFLDETSNIFWEFLKLMKSREK